MAKNSARSAAAALLDGLYHRASTRPDDTAVSTGGRSFSWWRLLDCARSVDLRRVPPGVILIDCGRTPQAIAAITACIESGHPFLLADDDFPEERQAALREDCSPVGTLSVHADHEIRFMPSSSVAKRSAKAEGLYWIYTSGSSGVPKATVIPAKAIVALLPALRERVPELAGARCLGVTASFGFDPALQQIFLALHGGMRLAIPSDNVRRAPDALLEFWSAQGVDVADGTPLLLRSLTRLPEHRMTPLSPRCLLIGGDLLRPQDVTALWDRYGPDVSVYNLYGVAECGIDSVVGKVEPEHVESLGTLAVGTELAHSEVLLLGEDRQPVPPGEQGEICIGGVGVGLGYPTQPDETNRSLIVLDGYGTLYRTGDLGRRLKDGRLLVTGRSDRQVKMAGRRVEPAEVEAAILRWVREQAADSDRVLGPRPQVRRCRECVLSEHYPGNGIDESGLCRYCRIPVGEIRSGWGYFRQIESLEDALDRARATKPGDYDALLLFSGGKDSSYVLYRLLDLGAKIVSFTFDNGFISDAAFENIERMCAETGVPHHYGHAKDGAGLLAESLRADATVCSGCFVGITATGAALAAELGCRFVVSGLSRGQIIDTKLLQFVRRGRTDLGDIDRELHEHRRLYLERRDAFARAVGRSPHGDDHGADVENLDYFRYDSVGVHGIRGYLGDRDARWRSPKDTGVCSTNCRANDAGIAEHLTKRGYHSYEGPLSWEVRLGTLSRDEALAKVEARADERNVILVHERLGRRTDVAVVAQDGGLAAFVEGHLPGGPEALRSWLGSRLPWYMVPGRIERLPAGLPRLPNHKVDYAALRSVPVAAPAPPDEAQDELTAGLRTAWAEVLSRAPTSDTDHFFHLGGDSLAATDLASIVERHTNVSVPIITIFESPEFGSYREAVRRCAPAPRKEASSALGI